MALSQILNRQDARHRQNICLAGSRVVYADSGKMSHFRQLDSAIGSCFPVKQQDRRFRVAWRVTRGYSCKCSARSCVMRILAVYAVAIGLVLGGFPHPCKCECAQTAAALSAVPAATPATPSDSTCPYCHSGQSEPTPDTPRPCKCGTCELVLAVADSSPEKALSPDSFGRTQFAPVDLRVASLDTPTLVKQSPTAPPGMMSPSRCALPILLGHLLF